MTRQEASKIARGFYGARARLRRSRLGGIVVPGWEIRLGEKLVGASTNGWAFAVANMRANLPTMVVNEVKVTDWAKLDHTAKGA